MFNATADPLRRAQTANGTSGQRKRRWPTLVIVLMIGLLAGVLAGGCGGAGSSAGGGISSPVPPPRPPGELVGLRDYRERCRQMDVNGANARVQKPSPAERKLNFADASTITAAVKLYATPADAVLHRQGTRDEQVKVSCLIEARLQPDSHEFTIEPTGWVARSFLSRDAARWSWQVTPTKGGDHGIVLSLRPVVRLDGDRDTAEDANVVPYKLRVHVAVPWYSRPSALMHQVTGLLVDAKAMFVALGAALVALVAVFKVVRPKRHAANAKQAAKAK